MKVSKSSEAAGSRKQLSILWAWFIIRFGLAQKPPEQNQCPYSWTMIHCYFRQVNHGTSIEDELSLRLLWAGCGVYASWYRGSLIFHEVIAPLQCKWKGIVWECIVILHRLSCTAYSAVTSLSPYYGFIECVRLAIMSVSVSCLLEIWLWLCHELALLSQSPIEVEALKYLLKVFLMLEANWQ